MYSAGVLLYYRIGDIKHFLLGKDTKYNCWSDFGGKVEYIDDNDPIQTASREFYEETAGVISSKCHIKHLITTKGKQLNCTSYKKRRYYMFLVECLEISGVVFRQFEEQQSLLSIIDSTDMFRFREKKNIQTFTMEEILSNEQMFRPVFYSSFSKNKDIIQSAY